MAEKIRVAHVIPRYFPVFGGAETQCRLLVSNLIATGEVEVPFVLTGRVERQIAKTERIDDVIIHRLGIAGIGRWNWYLFYLVSSWFLIRRRKSFDVIHCHATSVMGLAMTITGSILRKPVVLLLASNGELLVGTGEMIRRYRLKRLRAMLRKKMASYIARRATIVALNREGAKEVESVASGRVVTIPNGVDLRQYRPPDHEVRKSARSAYGFGSDDIVLLFVGRFVVGKGIHVLLEAFDRLTACSMSNRLHLCLAGGGQLQQNAVGVDLDPNATGMQQRIHILPPRIPAVEYYQMADMFVFPSQREGLPNVVLEALAVGLPCVLSNIDPHCELLETNPDADIRLFATDDPEQLSAVIQTALDALQNVKSPSTRDVGLSVIYQIDNVAREYITLYLRLIGANL